MKNFSICFCLLSLIIMPFYCSSQSGQQQTENQLKKVIVGETEAFFKKDFEKARSFSSSNPKSTSIQSLPDGTVTTLVGGVVIGDGKEPTGKVDYSKMSFKLLGQSDWNISIRQNVAWANYRQLTSLEGTEYISDEIRVLEKENGNWKIVLSSTMVH